MLEAKKNSWFSEIFKIYNRNLLKRRFNSFQIHGLDKLQTASNKIPLLIYANHTSWWDGLVVFEILSRTDLNLFVLMEAEQLDKYNFFQYLGAFGVNRHNFRDGHLCVKYAVRLLKENPQNTVVIFPQGKILPNDHPIEFFSGLSRIVRMTENCRVVPMAFRFEFLQNFKPEIFVAVGDPIEFQNCSKLDLKPQTNIFADKLGELVKTQKLQITESRTDAYTDLFKPYQS